MSTCKLFYFVFWCIPSWNSLATREKNVSPWRLFCLELRDGKEQSLQVGCRRRAKQSFHKANLFLSCITIVIHFYMKVFLKWL